MHHVLDPCGGVYCVHEFVSLLFNASDAHFYLDNCMKRYLQEQMISITMNKCGNDIIRYTTRLTSILGTSSSGLSAKYAYSDLNTAWKSFSHASLILEYKMFRKLKRLDFAYLVSYDYHWRTLPFKLNYYRFQSEHRKLSRLRETLVILSKDAYDSIKQPGLTSEWHPGRILL
jgi:hypothetical protein